MSEDPALRAPVTSARAFSVAAVLVLPIRGWQHLSAVLPPRCRFHPSCSEYAIQALRAHGAVRGLWLAVRRLGRCHPWHPGGLDPVPIEHTFASGRRRVLSEEGCR